MLSLAGTALRVGLRVLVGGRECPVATGNPDATGTVVRCTMPSFADVAEADLPLVVDVTVMQADQTNVTLERAFAVQVSKT